MDRLSILIQKLETKINSVLAQYKSQQTAIQKLKQENQSLKQQISHLQKTAHRQPASLMANSNRQTSELEQHIDNCIQDIERSIVYLEKFQSWKNSQ